MGVEGRGEVGVTSKTCYFARNALGYSSQAYLYGIHEKSTILNSLGEETITTRTDNVENYNIHMTCIDIQSQFQHINEKVPQKVRRPSK